jgi:hypothetical protein
LQVVVLVELAHLAVDPAITEGDFDGLIVGDAFDPRASLGDLEPQPLGGRVPPFEEGLPRLARGEREDRQVRLGGDGVSFRRSVPLQSESVEVTMGVASPFARSQRCATITKVYEALRRLPSSTCLPRQPGCSWVLDRPYGVS